MRYCKDIANFLFPVFWACLAVTTKKGWYQLVEKFDAYLQVRNQICLSRLSWNIAKILQTCYFGYFGHGSVHPPKTINSPWRKLWCFSKCLKSTWSLTFFLRYYNLKNPTTWLLTSILAHNFRKEFCPIKGSRWNINNWCGAVALSYFMTRSFFSFLAIPLQFASR